MGETEEPIGTVREMQGPTEYWTAGVQEKQAGSGITSFSPWPLELIAAWDVAQSGLELVAILLP